MVPKPSDAVMVDWTEAETHLAHMGITAEEGFYVSLFPPKSRAGLGSYNLPQEGQIHKHDIENRLAALPGYGFGYIPNWGGIKDAEIAYCRALFYEDDNPASSMEQKKAQWQEAGLPQPSLQVWTGGKSVHNYWILETPCSGHEFRQAQKLLFKHVKATVTDGPFTESKEIVGGFWMIQVKSKEEAVEWAKRAPMLHGDIIEVRQVQEMSDFPTEIQDLVKPELRNLNR